MRLLQCHVRPAGLQQITTDYERLQAFTIHYTTSYPHHIPHPPMPPHSSPHTVGSPAFDPDAFFDAWDQSSVPQDNDFRTAIIKAFNLKSNDDYVYHAIASVTLAQVQHAINHGAQAGLNAWYRDAEGRQVRLRFPRFGTTGLLISRTAPRAMSSPIPN